MTDPNETSAVPDVDTPGIEIQDPIEVTPPQTQEGSLLERVNATWIAVFVIVALAISGAIAIWLTVYVVTHDDPTEQQDFDQLSRIADPLQSIATLMIGTIFGFSVQSGASALNKQRADKNKDEADDQYRRATENAKRASANARVAAVQAKTGHALRDAMDEMRQHISAVPVAAPDSAAILTSLGSTRGVEEALANADTNLLDPRDFERYLR